MSKKNPLVPTILLICFTFLLFIVSPVNTHAQAGAELRYIPDKEGVKDIILENSDVKYTITIGNTVMLSGAVH
ncbi:MAG: hypothetical protein ACYSRZ_10160, partial [Planctomycetota bacterium]